MGYQALYRKYRPKTFQEVYGQTSVVDTLKNIIESNNTTHAYLFSGPRGTGKTTLARIFAKGLQCTAENKPCCQCQSCLDAERGIHSDIIEMDGASNNGVDEIRDLREKMKYAPSTSKYKIYIIDEVHMLTTGAFNALLKTLEEPPEHVIFMMATTELYKVPATILSRCMRFELQELSLEHLVQSLRGVVDAEGVRATDDALTLIATEAKGGSRDSLTLLEQVISFAHDNEITKQVAQEALGGIDSRDVDLFRQTIKQHQTKEALEIIDHIEHKGKKVDDFIELIVQSIIDDVEATQREVEATDMLLLCLRNYRFYRQGILAIKAGIVRFFNTESRITELELKIEKLSENYTPTVNLEEEVKTDVLEPIIHIDPNVSEPEVAEPVILEVYHEKQEEKAEETPPEFLEAYGATKDSTVEDMQVRNDIYQSILKDEKITEALSTEPLVLMKDEIARENTPKPQQKAVFQEISITEDNKAMAMQEMPQPSQGRPQYSLMRVLIEAALFPEKSPIKYAKRRWNIIPSLPGSYFTKLLEDTEVRAASENALVISCYLESIKQELEKHDIRIEVTNIIKKELKIDMPYIIVTENEWLKTRSLFVEQWKQGNIDETTLQGYEEEERADLGVVDGQIGFYIEEPETIETESDSVKDAKALFGDIVEIK